VGKRCISAIIRHTITKFSRKSSRGRPAGRRKVGGWSAMMVT
jgi:hypothetical protein